METFTLIISILLLFAAFPIGYFLAKLTKEELVAGRKAFFAIIIISILAAIIVLFLNFGVNEKLSFVFAFLFFIIVSAISMWKSYDKKFIK